jgi:hypothetical protein
MFEYLSSLKGQYVALWGMRWVYRGKVEEVKDDGVLLDDAWIIEVTGATTASGVVCEQRAEGNKLFIPFGTFESIAQPAFASSKGDE